MECSEEYGRNYKIEYLTTGFCFGDVLHISIGMLHVRVPGVNNCVITLIVDVIRANMHMVTRLHGLKQKIHFTNYRKDKLEHKSDESLMPITYRNGHILMT